VLEQMPVTKLLEKVFLSIIKTKKMWHTEKIPALYDKSITMISSEQKTHPQGILSVKDPDIFNLIVQEDLRQKNLIELIASENFVSQGVLEAQGSILTNKYAEGYPGLRYYGGCRYVDGIEELAIQRVCKLFNCQFANVQPHSGSQANQAVFLAFLNPGDTILSLSLNEGGHLTHGSSANLSGKYFHIQHYGLDPITHQIDLDHLEKQAKKHRPKIIIAGGSAYPRAIPFADFRRIADDIGALLMVDMAHFAGLVAAGALPSPLPYAHIVTSTTHKTLRGPRGGIILSNDKNIAQALDKAVFPGLQGGPLMHIIAAKAVCFHEALQDEFKQYGRQVIDHAKALGESLHHQGFQLITGGTDTHLLLIDLRNNMPNLSGKMAEKILEEGGITCNKNSVPQDTRPYQQTSGIRLGTPAGTTRGFGPEEFRTIGTWIGQLLKAFPDTHALNQNIQSVQEKVRQMCKEFPLNI
jgi:glycine hydroxymethyltransferase